MLKILSIGLVSTEAATIYPQDGDVVPYETALATTDDELKNKELRVYDSETYAKMFLTR